ncbi:MAG: T9SS type A sorting domain-containing protein [Bacteroidota bacterium]
MKKWLFFLSFSLCLMLAKSNAQPWMQAPYLQKSKQSADFYDIRNSFNAWWGNRPYVRGKGYKPFKRWEYVMTPKVYPTGQLPAPDKYRKEYLKFMENYSKSGIQTKAGGSWTPLGLTSWQLGYSGYNPGNGRLNAITVDVSDRNRIYVAAPSGGIWISNNGGLNWNTYYDEMPTLGTSAVAIHPNNHNTIFIGTGDRDAWDTKGTGLYKSTDGGLTWNTTGLSFAPDYMNVNKILINPINPNTMFAATSDGVYKSINGGNTWQLSYNQSEVKDLKYRPNDTSVLYGSGSYFIRSTDAGNNFTRNTTDLPNDTARLEFDVTIANPMYIYVVSSRPDNTFGAVYRSTDGGLSFTQRANSPNILGYAEDGSDGSGQAWYDLAIAVAPNNANEVFVGGINVWKSIDGGASFTVNTMWYTGSPYTYIHCDIHSLNFYGDSLYAGSDGGIFLTGDHGTSWSDLSAGLGISQFYRMGSSENAPDLIAAGAQDIGSNLYRNGNWWHVYGADGMEAIVDYQDSNVIFTSSQMGGIVKSEDGGVNFMDARPNDSISGGWVTPYVMDAIDHLTLFAGYKDVYKTTDGAYVWQNISTNLTGGSNLDALSVAASNNNYIYASSSNTLYYSANGGTTWDSIVPDGNQYINYIDVDPLNPLRVWLATSSWYGDKIFYSHDGAHSFTDISSNLTDLGVNCIAYQKNAHDALYVGTEVGIFYRDSTMALWVPFMTNLPNVPVRELEINYATNRIRAATYGRGIWEAPLNSYAAISEGALHDAVEVFPNPATDELTINISLKTLSSVSITIFDVTGRMVRNIEPGTVLTNRRTVDVHGLSQGSYFVRIKSGDDTVVRKINIIR